MAQQEGPFDDGYWDRVAQQQDYVNSRLGPWDRWQDLAPAVQRNDPAWQDDRDSD